MPHPTSTTTTNLSQAQGSGIARESQKSACHGSSVRRYRGQRQGGRESRGRGDAAQPPPWECATLRGIQKPSGDGPSHDGRATALENKGHNRNLRRVISRGRRASPPARSVQIREINEWHFRRGRGEGVSRIDSVPEGGDGGDMGEYCIISDGVTGTQL